MVTATPSTAIDARLAGTLNPTAVPPMSSSVAPPPLQAPSIPPMTAPTPFNYVPPVGAGGAAGGTFTGKAPTPTPYGTFTAPDPTTFQTDPSYQWRLQQGQKALERSSASRGTLLTGGTAKALTDYSQGAASQEYGNAYNRALQSYDTNRDTNNQNFGQLLGSYNADLAGFNANTSSGRLGLDAATAGYDRNYGAARDAYGDASGNTIRQTNVANINNDNAYQRNQEDYQRQVASNAAINAGILAQSRLPKAALPGVLSPGRWG